MNNWQNAQAVAIKGLKQQWYEGWNDCPKKTNNVQDENVKVMVKPQIILPELLDVP